MAALRFRSEAVRRDCCDLARMRSLWGPDIAYLVSHRLQQLEAMNTIEDLAFLPFESEVVDGVGHVEVAGGLWLVLEQGSTTPPGEGDMATIVITGVHERATERPS